ncbi:MULTISPECIES: biotin--[acetyl-CoA-carboxylase] ligase [Prochlorococcus]|uniref:Biotin-(Acetyl-CoA carboxylase) ligase n=1 Tax=Prochlorococcus marinus (strain SARG / CCMP1375 / SS120) TaxID=167539 RepID=Q7TVA7_PROMA|nr:MULTISPECIES: biotin--[acetyl-CoA-carboxylase] ligase [Prochlorococcus]AAP99475.1 Biotin-(acetyl-CoA carboxylase) ligase [Prochlorococcus marinus subsp. marinus str. CCMP1375]KGG11256.1 Biotin-protein ligase [Prochlorococcus marinus str. LG]KGG21595.1 Biotin-protein ligase [Prochlorococcus marinus str. SS2]KGG23063.1 Biotin-protein ligase [Prochlorococcus marinus str. SS35]KGG33770.1 Biotin-protein ligase [Prochlorococcus marinus str. SS51]
MQNSLPWTGAAPITCLIKRSEVLKKSWVLRWKPVCGSTDIELSRWLKQKPLSVNNPRAFLTGRQSHGRGQRGRIWDSPLGGVWLSAAMTCDVSVKSAGLFGLAVAVALSNRLERSLIPVQIKWPNDLLVNGKKIAGLLPRVFSRGQEANFLSLGIGLNVCNHVPKGGISLLKCSGKKNISTLKWSLEVLLAIEQAKMLLLDPKHLCKEGEKFLWAKQIKKSQSNEIWDVEGLDLDGKLRVSRGFIKENWNRWE